eukprot:750929-Amphidinium_carterae.1
MLKKGPPFNLDVSDHLSCWIEQGLSLLLTAYLLHLLGVDSTVLGSINLPRPIQHTCDAGGDVIVSPGRMDPLSVKVLFFGTSSVRAAQPIPNRQSQM